MTTIWSEIYYGPSFEKAYDENVTRVVSAQYFPGLGIEGAWVVCYTMSS